MPHAKSIMFFGRSGKTYRVYFNPQRGYWYVAYSRDDKRVRHTLDVKTRPEAEAKVKELDASGRQDAEPPARFTWADFQKQYLEYKTNQGKAIKTVSRYKAALQAFERHLVARSISYADDVTLAV